MSESCAAATAHRIFRCSAGAGGSQVGPENAWTPSCTVTNVSHTSHAPKGAVIEERRDGVEVLLGQRALSDLPRTLDAEAVRQVQGVLAMTEGHCGEEGETARSERS